MFRSSLTLLAAPLALALPLAAQARPADLPAPDPILGEPLVINGELVPFETVRRQVCLGEVGQSFIEASKLRIFIEEELERRKAMGASPEDFQVTDEDIDALFAELEKQVKKEYPEGGMSIDQILPRDQSNLAVVRTTELFKKLFLPDNPEDYPDLTLAALKSQENGEQLISQMQMAFEQRKAQGKEMGAAERMFQTMMLQQVIKYLNDTADIVSDLESLGDPGILLRVNGKDILVADVWKLIKERVSPIDVRSAKQWITNMTLLKKALTDAGAWLSDEEAEKAYHEHVDPYKDSIFSIERLAVAVSRFPSVEAYKQYYRAYSSFRKLIADEMTDEELDRFAKERTRHLVGQVSVDVDVILLSAYDFENKRWKENGWQEAEKKVKEVLHALVDEGRPWEQVLAEYSEFYDPPIPASQRNQPEKPQWYTDKGRFRNKQRNALLQNLGESEYWLFLNGDSITDYIFFEQEVGKLGKPMKGPKGWYIPLLLRRSDPPARLSTSPEDMRQLTEQDYVSHRLREYVRKLVAENQVYGLET